MQAGSLNLFLASGLDQQALAEMHFCSAKMRETQSSSDAAFYRQAFARSVFSYLIVASNHLWEDAKVSQYTLQKPAQTDREVFSYFLAVFDLHENKPVESSRARLQPHEWRLLLDVEQRLERLIFPHMSLDLAVSLQEIEQIEQALELLGQIIADRDKR